MIAYRSLASFTVHTSGAIVFWTPNRGEIPLCDRSRLAAARRDTELYADRFRRDVGGSFPNLSQITKAVRNLHEGMSQVMLLLSDQRAGRVWEISVALREAWLQWRAESDLVPVIEVHGDDESFPFELLPLLSIAEIDDDFANIAEAEDALRAFIGFGACIRRTLGEEVLGDLVAGPKVPVQVFLYDDLKGARIELTDVFGGLDDVTVDGPWPRDGMDTATVRRQLIDALYDPEVDLCGKRTTSTPVQIQHFACHCDTTTSQTGSGYLLKLGTETAPHKVTLSKISNGFLTRLEKLGPVQAARPLVVANACGSAKIDIAARRSFPTWFLSQRHRGFIGTETDIEDAVAASFSRFLYEEFIGNRKPLGEAVVLARQRLLTERNNPLGLLYTFYGDPDLGIVPAPIAPASRRQRGSNRLRP